jgi:hypothetical protein
MLIQILRRTTISGRPVLPGEVHEASDRDARFLIGARKAQQLEEPQEVAAAPPPTPTRRKRTPITTED